MPLKAKLNYTTPYEALKSQFPHVVRVKKSVGVKNRTTSSGVVYNRQTLTEWFKQQGINTSKTLGSNSMVWIDKGWQEFRFKQDVHAMIFLMTWEDLLH